MVDGWQTLTLAEKIPIQTIRQSPRLVPYLIGKQARGLRVQWEIKPHEEWLTLKAKDEDAEVFLNMLKDKFGEAPISYSQVERWDVFRGFITGAGRVGFGVYVDLGISQPSRKDALYPLYRMRAQLADGLTKASRDIVLETGLTDYFPVSVLVTEIDGGKISVELTDGTREKLLSWKSYPFDRVIAIGIDKDRLEKVVHDLKLEPDVIEVQNLSLLVQCLVCKIDTDSPGIIAKIGKHLKGVSLTAFKSPRKQQLGF